MKNQKEVWKKVIGFEGFYEVSDLGRVKSLERKVKHWRGGFRIIKERIVKTSHKHEYYTTVSLCREGVVTTIAIHKLVAINFLNHTPCGYDVVIDHIDNDIKNNKASNLALVSSRYNVTKNIKDVGVTQNKNTKNWIARCHVNKERIYIGTYTTKEEALKMYNTFLSKL